MQSPIQRLSRLQNLAYLLLRLMVGQIMIVSGYMKVFVAGLPHVIDNFVTWHIPCPQLAAPFIAGLELVGGTLLVLGLFTRYLGVLFTCQFVVSLWTMVNEGGYPKSRLDSLILVVAFLIATTGAGAYSLDAKLGRRDA